MKEKAYKCFLSKNLENTPCSELLVYERNISEYLCSNNKHSACPEEYAVINFMQKHFDNESSLLIKSFLDSLLSNVGFANDIRAIKLHWGGNNFNPVISL